MTYTKMQPADFTEKLGKGGYKSATAARRAVGKAAFSQKGKEQCYEAINAHFGEAAKSPTKAKTKKTKPAVEKPAVGPTIEVNKIALAEIELADKRVGTITQALAALTVAKEASPEVDIKAEAAAASAALGDIIKGIHSNVLGKVVSGDNGLSQSPAAQSVAVVEAAKPTTTTAG